MTTELLVLKRALASLAFGEWHGEDYDVLANGVVVGRIFTSLVAPKDAPWFWSLARSRFESETDERQRRDVRRSDGRIRQELATVSERMLARLGHLGYWLGCGLAVVALVSGVYVLQHGLDQDRRWIVYVASIGSAVACWLIGRACKYFLAGE